jgi:hypothetical protein
LNDNISRGGGGEKEEREKIWFFFFFLQNNRKESGNTYILLASSVLWPLSFSTSHPCCRVVQMDQYLLLLRPLPQPNKENETKKFK